MSGNQGNLPRIDVVILTWNDGEDAEAAVASALASLEVDVAIQVVDNGSDVPFPTHPDPRVNVHRSKVNLGVGGGRMLGVSMGDRDLICFLDSDAMLTPRCLSRLCEPFGSTENLGLTAPVFAGQPPEVGAGKAPSVGRKIARALSLTDRYASMPRSGLETWPIEFAIGACQVVSRSALEEIGGIDTSSRFGPEDVDMCLRLGDQHFRCLQVGDAVCHHVARRSSRRLLSRRGIAHATAVLRHFRSRRQIR